MFLFIHKMFYIPRSIHNVIKRKKTLPLPPTVTHWLIPTSISISPKERQQQWVQLRFEHQIVLLKWTVALMWGMLLNRRDWLLKPDSFPHRLDFSGEKYKEQGVLQLVPVMLTELKMETMWSQERSKIFSCLNKHLNFKTCPSSLPAGCPPWHSGSSPPRQCDAVGAGRWSAWLGWRRCPG